MSNLRHKEKVKERAQARTLRKEMESMTAQLTGARETIANFNSSVAELRNSNIFNILQDILGELRATKYAIWLAFPAVKSRQLVNSLPSESEPEPAKSKVKP